MTGIYCEIPEKYTSQEEIDLILERTKSIAIVLLSPKEKRDSNMVARYLMKHGYQVIPINPGQREILGERCYRSLNDVPFSVDMVDIFLNPTGVPQVVDQAIEKGVKCIWMQLGIVHNESAQRARDEGIRVVMDRCIKIENERIPRQE